MRRLVGGLDTKGVPQPQLIGKANEKMKTVREPRITNLILQMDSKTWKQYE